MQRAVKVVALGGGTGLSTMLRGIKQYTDDITAIVTVCDDGGGSGVLRQEMGMLPPGDIRNCILALAYTEPEMEKLLQYRFNDGSLNGQSFGNLFLAAMNGISSSFLEAVERVSDVLKVKGKVIPVTLSDIHLVADFSDGTCIRGESAISAYGKRTRTRIRDIRIDPADVAPVASAVNAIEQADVIILGPGSLYTSILPNLLVPGITEAIRASGAPCVYVCNIMTQAGETHDMDALDHINVIRHHADPSIISYAILNIGAVPYDVRRRYYSEEGSSPVMYDLAALQQHGIHVLPRDCFALKGEHVRHNADVLAEAIMSIVTRIHKRPTTLSIHALPNS